MSQFLQSQSSARLLVDCRNQLGEGVQWNAEHGRVYWTDIFGDALFSCDEHGESLYRLDLEEGLCAFAFADGERLLAAFKSGLFWLDPQSGARELIQAYQPDQKHTRMNDGGLDRQGRFVVGGIDDDGMKPITPVWRISPKGIDTVIDDVGCANSICFSPCGTRMYFADTAGPDIFVYSYDPLTGTPSNKRFFARMDADFGLPDGSTVDSEGALWNARFGGACVQRFLPSGVQDLRVSLSVPNVTCCCIGGTDMNRLFITSARLGMSDEALENSPEAGGLFVHDLDVRGIEHGKYNNKGDTK